MELLTKKIEGRKSLEYTLDKKYSATKLFDRYINNLMIILFNATGKQKSLFLYFELFLVQYMLFSMAPKWSTEGDNMVQEHIHTQRCFKLLNKL
jgi:hypothetical protein